MIRQPSANADVQELYRLLMQGSPLINGVLLGISAAASTATQSAQHGMGRPYFGAFAVTCDQNVAFRALPASGFLDSDKRLYFALSAATAANLRLWVF